TQSPKESLLGPLLVLGSSSFRTSPETVQASLGETVKLSCEVMHSSTTGCSWLYQKPGAASKPIFLMYLSNIRSKTAEGLDARYISGSKAGGLNFHLTLHRFREEDQGYYFCSFLSNSVLYFSNFMSVFLPAKPTTVPTMPPSKRAPTKASQTVSLPPEVCRPSGSAVDTRKMGLTCDMYIWAPLAGTSAILLLSLVITVICHRRNAGKPLPAAPCTLRLAFRKTEPYSRSDSSGGGVFHG
uniref:T-cell surface glycoprotein CD8 alpha chain n=1 Tax=Catagonus wagneri TaxID=51154 RepID=A0A8C3YF16_9CETA